MLVGKDREFNKFMRYINYLEVAPNPDMFGALLSFPHLTDMISERYLTGFRLEYIPFYIRARLFGYEYTKPKESGEKFMTTCDEHGRAYKYIRSYRGKRLAPMPNRFGNIELEPCTQWECHGGIIRKKSSGFVESLRRLRARGYERHIRPDELLRIFSINTPKNDTALETLLEIAASERTRIYRGENYTKRGKYTLSDERIISASGEIELGEWCSLAFRHPDEKTLEIFVDPTFPPAKPQKQQQCRDLDLGYPRVNGFTKKYTFDLPLLEEECGRKWRLEGEGWDNSNRKWRYSRDFGRAKADELYFKFYKRMGETTKRLAQSIFGDVNSTKDTKNSRIKSCRITIPDISDHAFPVKYGLIGNILWMAAPQSKYKNKGGSRGVRILNKN